MKAPQGIEGAVGEAASDIEWEINYGDNRPTYSDVAAIIQKHLTPAVQPLVEALEKIGIEYLDGYKFCGTCDMTAEDCDADKKHCVGKIARAALETWREG